MLDDYDVEYLIVNFVNNSVWPGSKREFVF